MRTIALVLLFVSAAASAAAQPFGPPPGRRNLERIEQLKKVRLVELLDLNEELSVRFFARMKQHEDAMRSLAEGRNALLDRVERLVRNEAEEKEFETLFPQMHAIDDRISAERKAFFDNLGSMLTPVQRGKFLLFERQFDRELREAMREVRERRRGEE